MKRKAGSQSAGYHYDATPKHPAPTKTPTVAPPPSQAARGPAGNYKGAASDYTAAVEALPSKAQRVTEQATRSAARRQARAKKQRTRAILQSGKPKAQKAAQRLKTQKPKKYKAPVLPKDKPNTFQGKKTAGTPTLEELKKSRKANTLQVNRKGAVTTPKVRVAARRLKKAKRAAAKAAPTVEGPLTHGQKVFAKQVAKETPLSPRVVAAQELAEESGSYASSREAEGNHNWLNIGYFDSGPGSLTQDQTWSNPKRAAHATAQFLKGQKYGASSGIQAILPESKGKSDKAQIAAIANSGWATSPTYRQSIEGTHALVSSKPGNPKAVKRLKVAQKQAKAVGLKTAESPREQHMNYLKVFGKEVGKQLKLVKAGKLTQGKGSVVLSHSYDLSKGHEPEIAARLKLLSAKLGKPVYIISGYRTPQHSVEVRGFADDPHTEGKAADIGVGGPTLASAAAISEADYESVGLYRPFGTARGGSSAEDNHVQLLNGGTPATGGSNTTTASASVPSSSIAAYAAATGTSAATVKKQQKSKRLTIAQIEHKLKALSSPSVQATSASSTSSGSTTLSDLERKYSKAVA